MARTDTLGHFLTDVADAIREKKGSSDTIQASDFDTEIENLPSGGDLSEYYNTNISAGTILKSGVFGAIKKLPPFYFSGISADYMFDGWQGDKIDCSNFDTTNTTSFAFMFRGCKNVTELDLSNFKSPQQFNGNYMFQNCQKLMKLDIRNMDFDKIKNTNMTFSSVPNNCEIIVKNTASKEKVLALNGNFTNVKTVAEYEAE